MTEHLHHASDWRLEHEGMIRLDANQAPKREDTHDEDPWAKAGKVTSSSCNQTELRGRQTQ